MNNRITQGSGKSREKLANVTYVCTKRQINSELKKSAKDIESERKKGNVMHRIVVRMVKGPVDLIRQYTLLV